MFEQRRLRTVRINRRFQKHSDFIQRSAWTKIGWRLAGLKSAIVTLVAIHADVIGKPGGQFRRVHDRVIRSSAQDYACRPFSNVQFARAVTPFTTDTQLNDWRIFEQAFPAFYRLRPAGMAGDAFW